MADVKPRRGRPQLLDEEQVLDAALAVLDAEGLSALTFRRIGSDLGVSHMTLYGYFANKDALLEALVARTIGVASIEHDADAPWDQTLRAAMKDIHDELVRRPGIAEILIAHEITESWLHRVREQLLDILRDGGFSDSQAVDGLSVLFNYLLGAVMIETRRGRGGSAGSFELGLGYLIDGLKTSPPD